MELNMIKKKWNAKILSVLFLISFSPLVSAYDYSVIIDHLSSGKLGPINTNSGFRIFHNDFIKLYSKHCRSQISDYEIRSISINTVRTNAYGYTDEEKSAPTNVYIEKKYLEKFESYFQTNFQAEKINVFGQLLSKGVDGLQESKSTMLRNDKILIEFLKNKCSSEKVKIVYENLYRKTHNLYSVQEDGKEKSLLGEWNFEYKGAVRTESVATFAKDAFRIHKSTNTWIHEDCDDKYKLCKSNLKFDHNGNTYKLRCTFKMVNSNRMERKCDRDTFKDDRIIDKTYGLSHFFVRTHK